MKQRNTPYNTLITATPGNQKEKEKEKKATEALTIPT
jgi:hypothetical protein